MKTEKTKKKIVLTSLSQIPDHFESEDSERDWWAAHEFGEELLDSLEDVTGELDRLLPERHEPANRKRA